MVKIQSKGRKPALEAKKAPSTHFCFGNDTAPLCNGEKYWPGPYYCRNGKIYSK
jgi:hypothetical protein